MDIFTLNLCVPLSRQIVECGVYNSSADRVSLFSSESPSFLAIWSLFLKFLVGAYVVMLPTFASPKGYKSSPVDSCKSSSVLLVSPLVAFMF